MNVICKANENSYTEVCWNRSVLLRLFYMFRYNIKFGITTLQIYKIECLHITEKLNMNWCNICNKATYIITDAWKNYQHSWASCMRLLVAVYSYLLVLCNSAKTSTVWMYLGIVFGERILISKVLQSSIWW